PPFFSLTSSLLPPASCLLPSIYTSTMSAADFSILATECSDSEHSKVELTVSVSLSVGWSFCQIRSIPSHEGAKGGSPKEQAFQLPLTGALRSLHIPPRLPVG
ncbi:MAG: hypothetical protein F6K41_38830, partial [Symploca sp. SIO3E6]|nr:hypothetical protein [Caldora sp. SIO3E6]